MTASGGPSAMGRVARGLSDLLRASGDYGPRSTIVPRGRLVLVVWAAGALHGAVMGSFAGPWGALWAAVKVPILLTLAPIICWPSFRVIHGVLGLAGDEPAARRAVLCGQATLALALLSLSPVLAFCYAASSDYHEAKLVNTAVFGLASLAAQLTLARHYRPLLRKDRRHRVALVLWPALYLFVALQLAYALRPFVGNPDFPTEFVRDDWMGNVYLDLYWAVRGALG